MGSGSSHDNEMNKDLKRVQKECADGWERIQKERADKERADKERADKERADKERADEERADENVPKGNAQYGSRLLIHSKSQSRSLRTRLCGSFLRRSHHCLG